MTSDQYLKKRETLILYLTVKVSESDWHGVSDCANDLRVLEATWEQQKNLLPYKQAYIALMKK